MKPGKFFDVLMPTLICFGPLIMVLWVKVEEAVRYAPMIGSFMVIAALMWMNSRIQSLQRQMEELKNEKK